MPVSVFLVLLNQRVMPLAENLRVYYIARKTSDWI